MHSREWQKLRPASKVANVQAAKGMLEQALAHTKGRAQCVAEWNYVIHGLLQFAASSYAISVSTSYVINRCIPFWLRQYEYEGQSHHALIS